MLGAGSEEQKQRFLPQIAAGRLKTAMAFTEAGGGTDLLGGMQTTATRVDGGWGYSTATLNNERLVNAAFCLGMLDGVLEDALEHLQTRRAFGHVIGEFQALQYYVADIAMWQKQGELMLLDGARRQSGGQPCANASKMAKVLCSEYAGRAADLGIQILGGMGYSAETDMQRYWRDARLLRIGPISNEMARNMIAEGLGLPRSF